MAEPGKYSRADMALLDGEAIEPDEEDEDKSDTEDEDPDTHGGARRAAPSTVPDMLVDDEDDLALQAGPLASLPASRPTSALAHAHAHAHAHADANADPDTDAGADADADAPPAAVPHAPSTAATQGDAAVSAAPAHAEDVPGGVPSDADARPTKKRKIGKGPSSSSGTAALSAAKGSRPGPKPGQRSTKRQRKQDAAAADASSKADMLQLYRDDQVERARAREAQIEVNREAVSTMRDLGNETRDIGRALIGLFEKVLQK
jgi:hypothetical protein